MSASKIARARNTVVPRILGSLHIDPPLLFATGLLSASGLCILYSATNQNIALLAHQCTWVVLSATIALVLAQVHPRRYEQGAPWFFVLSLLLLCAVLFFGHSSKGAQRWLSIGFMRFQPSEMLKLAMPAMLAWYLKRRNLPPDIPTLCTCGLLLCMPLLLAILQPDLGTGLIIFATGACVLLLAGIRWRHTVLLLFIFIISGPFLWHFLHDYQRNRVLTFLNPQRDPLGAGYHTIQSTIAVGSGGLWGKGYLAGTQSHLQFLPEHSTDFIFSVIGEEFGLMGIIILLALMTFIVLRGLYISSQAQDTFLRLLAGGLSLTFFLSFFINAGMAVGILPVVGVPLPLVSYGGSDMIIMMSAIGIIMSIRTHRKLLGC